MRPSFQSLVDGFYLLLFLLLAGTIVWLVAGSGCIAAKVASPASESKSEIKPEAETGDSSPVTQTTTNITLQGTASYAAIGVAGLVLVTLARSRHKHVGAVDRMVSCIHGENAVSVKKVVREMGYTHTGRRDAIGKAIHACVKRAKRKNGP